MVGIRVIIKIIVQLITHRGRRKDNIIIKDNMTSACRKIKEFSENIIYLSYIQGDSKVCSSFIFPLIMNYQIIIFGFINYTNSGT